MSNRILPFVFGLFTGSVLLLLCIGWALLQAPSWLVVDNEPQHADVGTILGGGGGSRLRKGVELYNAALVSELLLVDQRVEDWQHVIAHLCPDCDLRQKKVAILSGSTNTSTDAEITLAHCQAAGVKKVLVVTDPYHTRRADLNFQHRFRESGISVRVISSGDYGQLLTPDEQWWKDRATRETVWLEFGKCLHALATTSFHFDSE